MASWTSIPNSALDEGSALDAALFTNIRDDLEYLFERIARTGTHTTGVRLALARGVETISQLTSSGVAGTTNLIKYTVSPEIQVDFSGALDGNPNFDSAPTVLLSAEEFTDGNFDDYLAHDFVVSPYVQDGSITALKFDLGCVAYADDVSSEGFKVDVHWVAVGPVTSGE